MRNEEQKIQRIMELAHERKLDDNLVEVWDLTEDEPRLMETFSTMDEAKHFMLVGALITGILNPNRERCFALRHPAWMDNDSGSPTIH